MRIHFEPGSRYAYSGEGLILMQFVLETGPGLNVGDEMQRRVFDKFGMTRTSMMWREDFAGNLADGYGIDGSFAAHDRRSRPRAAGSMDTSIADFAKFLAGFSRGEGLSAKSRAEMITPQIAITTPSQFPTLVEATSPAMKAITLSAGLGARASFRRFPSSHRAEACYRVKLIVTVTRTGTGTPFRRVGLYSHCRTASSAA